MGRRATPELYVLASLVEDFAGWGPAVIQWAHGPRERPPYPYSDLISDYARLAPDVRERAERAVRALLTRGEVVALRDHFERAYPALAARLGYGLIELPLPGAEVAALLAPEPTPEGQTLAVRLPAEALTSPVPVIGAAVPWPWSSLDPADVARLIGVRERLGLPPVPPAVFAGAANG